MVTKKVELFDTHTHLDDRQLVHRVADVVADAASLGVTRMATIGCDKKSSLYSVHLAEKFPGVYAAVGVHPHDAKTLTDEVIELFAELAQGKKTVAIGEIGLDYYRDLSPRDVQRDAFVRQIDLARQLRKPIIIHDRDAHGDILSILKKENAGANGGIIHCFSGSYETAMECIKMGFHISFAGPLTYKNARNLHEAASKLPLERLLIETDCPYLTPEPHRGKTNSPSNVSYVAAKLAELRGMSYGEIAKITTENALTVYNIS